MRPDASTVSPMSRHPDLNRRPTDYELVNERLALVSLLAECGRRQQEVSSRFTRDSQPKTKGPTPKPLLERLLARVEVDPITGCWLWCGALDSQGYGRILVGRSAQRVHRVSYEIFVGPIPEIDGYHGTEICHRCDVTRCLCPDHLFPGDHTANMRDSIAKGRAKLWGRPPTDAEKMAAGSLSCVRVAP